MDSTANSTSFALSEEHRRLQSRVRAFVDEALVPVELECEENDGLSAERVSELTRTVVDWGFNAVNHSR